MLFCNLYTDSSLIGILFLDLIDVVFIYCNLYTDSSLIGILFLDLIDVVL